MQTEEELRVAEEYASTLSELTTISKVEINALTMLAEENRDQATLIAGCIENQLKAAKKERKLPILYLIDSICKNYPKSIYVKLFTQNIVSTFCHVFESSDERVKKSLHKLRMTWSATDIFPQRKLNGIDERVNELDPNWPVLHKIPSKAPRTRSQAQQALKTQEQKRQDPQQHQQQSAVHQASQLKPQQQIQQQQQQQQQSKQMENNMANNNETNKRVNNQQNGRNRKRQKMPQSNNINTNNNMNNANNNRNQPSESVLVPAPQQTFLNPNIVPVVPDITQVRPTSFMDPSITMVGPHPQLQNDPIHGQIPAGPFMDHNLILATGEPNPVAPQIPIICAPFPTQPPSTTAQMVPPPQLITTTATQPSQSTQVLTTQDQIEAASLQSLLDSLYAGKQCSNCSLRFDDNNKYAKHLDWHYRQNTKSDNVFARRKWYYPSYLWVQYREISDEEIVEGNPVNDTNSATDPLIVVNELEVHTAPASIDDEKNICFVCHETFEKFWAEEEEEWRLRDACQHDNDRVCHFKCLPDVQASVIQ